MPVSSLACSPSPSVTSPPRPIMPIQSVNCKTTFPELQNHNLSWKVQSSIKSWKLSTDLHILLKAQDIGVPWGETLKNRGNLGGGGETNKKKE